VLGYLQSPSVSSFPDSAYAGEVLGTSRHLTSRGEHIAIVDDEEAMTSVTSALLERLGYSTTCHTSAAQFLKAFEAAPELVDLVIVDVVMPGMSGIQLVNTLRQQGHVVPILLMTGFSVQSRLEPGGADGRMAFVRKPFTTAHLAQSVRRLLSARA
jgi:CheY-like chemotaxis protein